MEDYRITATHHMHRRGIAVVSLCRPTGPCINTRPWGVEEENQFPLCLLLLFCEIDVCYNAFHCFSSAFLCRYHHTMRVIEEEVQGVSDTLPSTVKAQLKRKRPISEVLENVELFTKHPSGTIPIHACTDQAAELAYKGISYLSGSL